MLDDLFKIFHKSEIQKCLKVIDETVAYNLPPEESRIFKDFHRYITDPQPEFITEWRIHPETEHLYHQLVNGILGHTQNAYACTHYHLSRLTNLESEVLEKLGTIEYEEEFGNSSMGVGNSLILDFEYQAFILSYRRCLEYFSKAICTYFSTKSVSFYHLSGTLKEKEPVLVSERLIKVHNKYINDFSFVLSKGKKSTRDKISHDEFISAGCINLNKQGFQLAGGEENLSPFNNQSLSKALLEKFILLRFYIQEMLCEFEESNKTIKSAESSTTPLSS